MTGSIIPALFRNRKKHTFNTENSSPVVAYSYHQTCTCTGNNSRDLAYFLNAFRCVAHYQFSPILLQLSALELSAEDGDGVV